MNEKIKNIFENMYGYCENYNKLVREGAVNTALKQWEHIKGMEEVLRILGNIEVTYCGSAEVGCLTFFKNGKELFSRELN